MVRTEIVEHVYLAKRYFAAGSVDLAWIHWHSIYDKLDGSDHMHELHQAMDLFSDEEVYGITDYGKRINGYA